MTKRLFDLILSSLLLILLLPLLILVSAFVWLDSPGDVFFTQVRIGRGGKPFRIFKFRTMTPSPTSTTSQVTASNDPRITRLGRYLRASKIDELPQLLNVWLGQMSFVGPRPEVPLYVSYYSPKDREIILSLRPGITDLASIKFRNESSLLAQYHDPHSAYVNEILPLKTQCYLDYVQNRSISGDIVIIFQTLRALFSR